MLSYYLVLVCVARDEDVHIQLALSACQHVLIPPGDDLRGRGRGVECEPACPEGSLDPSICTGIVPLSTKVGMTSVLT